MWDRVEVYDLLLALCILFFLLFLKFFFDFFSLIFVIVLCCHGVYKHESVV